MAWWKRNPRDIRPPVGPESGTWTNSKGSIRGQTAYVRRNTALQEHAPCAGFDSEVLVVVAFNSAGESGLPESEEDLGAVDAIEEQFKARLEAGGTAVLALVITCDGVRELYFYSSDPQGTIREWEHRIQPQIHSHRVEFRIRPDAEWEVYKKFA